MRKKILIFSILIFVIDQIAKLIIDRNLTNFVIVDNLFEIDLTYNNGVAFSFFSGNIIFIIIINIILLICLIKYITSFIENKRNIVAFSLVLGGLLGNLIDRIIYGHVIDYIKLIIIDYHAPIFNIADICIVGGVILLGIAIYKKEDINEDSGR